MSQNLNNFFLFCKILNLYKTEKFVLQNKKKMQKICVTKTIVNILTERRWKKYKNYEKFKKFLPFFDLPTGPGDFLLDWFYL